MHCLSDKSNIGVGFYLTVFETCDVDRLLGLFLLIHHFIIINKCRDT